MKIGDLVVAILAGGLATRLHPATEHVPKVLLEVAGRPFIDHQLRLLRHHGVRRVVLCIGHLGDKVRRHLGDGLAHGVECRYSDDGDHLLGTAGALRRAAPLLGEVFGVTYGDTLLDLDYEAVLADFEDRAGLGMMTVIRNGNRWDRSNVTFRDGRIVRYDKRRPSPEMDYIDYGFSILRREVLERIPPGSHQDLADLYRRLVAEGVMAAVEVGRRFYEIGTPASLAETRAFLDGPTDLSWRTGEHV